MYKYVCMYVRARTEHINRHGSISSNRFHLIKMQPRSQREYSVHARSMSAGSTRDYDSRGYQTTYSTRVRTSMHNEHQMPPKAVSSHHQARTREEGGCIFDEKHPGHAANSKDSRGISLMYLSISDPARSPTCNVTPSSDVGLRLSVRYGLVQNDKRAT
jgi:hypothetical protein